MITEPGALEPATFNTGLESQFEPCSSGFVPRSLEATSGRIGLVPVHSNGTSIMLKGVELPMLLSSSCLSDPEP
jgi:hypothetical protein